MVPKPVTLIKVTLLHSVFHFKGMVLNRAKHLIFLRSFLESNWDSEDLRVLEQFFENKVKYQIILYGIFY